MFGMLEILSKFANVNSSSVVGQRAPHLTPGRNAQFQVSNKDYAKIVHL